MIARFCVLVCFAATAAWMIVDSQRAQVHENVIQARSHELDSVITEIRQKMEERKI